jgi:hypothetical protein
MAKGRCFAGNAVIAGCADLIVATQDASIGMGGPAMIAGGGLGDAAPDEEGPISMQAPNGEVDVAVPDDAQAAVEVTKRLLGHFQARSRPGRLALLATTRNGTQTLHTPRLFEPRAHCATADHPRCLRLTTRRHDTHTLATTTRLRHPGACLGRRSWIPA